MDNEKYTELAEKIRTEIMDKIDFKNGIIQEISKEKQEAGYVLDVRWKRDVHFILWLNRWNGSFWYYAQRNGEEVSHTHYARKYEDQFFNSVQHLVNEIENGNFDFKKTISERIAEIVHERQLTSCMNDTKWKEFIHAMNEDMSISIPYDYKTLFEENREHLLFDVHYDIESFNYYHFKSIEWVKLQPIFYEHKHRGMLIDDEKVYYNVEAEFLALMNKYSIPYEYDETNAIYTIYGYK